MLLSSDTAMGTTFDADLIHRVGMMLATEVADRGVHLLLGPTVYLQRSPLLGRDFETFAEDPWRSERLASAYING
ncbi:hypothetical protein N7527_004656 [Penicillium freii]|nr:hypothetical protein N7527_004656 [Penicillium freii]